MLCNCYWLKSCQYFDSSLIIHLHYSSHQVSEALPFYSDLFSCAFISAADFFFSLLKRGRVSNKNSQHSFHFNVYLSFYFSPSFSFASSLCSFSPQPLPSPCLSFCSFLFSLSLSFLPFFLNSFLSFIFFRKDQPRKQNQKGKRQQQKYSNQLERKAMSLDFRDKIPVKSGSNSQ